MNLTRAAIQNNRVTLTLLVLVLVAGYLAYQSMPRAEDPGFPVRSAMVITQFPGASPERMEKLVTDKLEEAISEMPELDNVQSTSKTGISLVTVNLKSAYKEKDLRAIWDSLRRKVDSVRPSLPEGVIGPNVNDEFGEVFGTVIGLTGDGFSYSELKEIADEVRDQLLKLDDVAKVDIYGAQDERIFIEFKNERLSEIGLSPAQLQRTLESENIVIPGGRIRVGDERYALEPSGSFQSVADIEQVLIQVPGRPEVMPLGDVTRVSRGYVDPPATEFRDSATPGLGLAISMRKGGNIIRLGEDVEKLVSELLGRYPIGVQLDVLVFQPKDVAKVVDDFTKNLLQAIGIVMLSMVLFLGLRTGLVVASLIPTAIAASLLVMSWLGIGLDQISLAALVIALGMLVDNSTVMAESTMVEMEAGRDPVEAAVESATSLRIPLLTSSLTTSAAFLPIFLAESETGEYTAPLFTVVTITLLASWLLSITMTPLLCAKFLRVKASAGKPRTQGLLGRYRGWLARVLRYRYTALAIVAVAFVLGMKGLGLVPNVFFPPSDNPSFTAELRLPTGTAIEHTRDVASRVESFMRRELSTSDARPQGVEHWATYIGEGGPRFYLSYTPEQQSPNYAIIVATATDRPAVERAVRRVRDFIDTELPDVRGTVKPRALGPSSKAPVMFELSGSDTDTLFGLVDTLKRRLEKTPGTVNIRDDWGERTKKLVVEIDATRARRAGVTHRDVAISLQTALSGIAVTEYREGSDIIPVVFRSVAADRQDLGKIEALSVFSQATGRAVPLRQVADVDLVWEASRILRKGRRRTVTVLSDLDPGTNAASVNASVIPWLESESPKWGPGYGWDIGGEAKNSEKANKSIADKLPIAAFVIVMLLVWQFNSLRRPLIILTAIPLALIGVALGLLGFRSYFGFMTFLGVISLAGIVINNAIVLIDRIDIEIRELGRDPATALLEAGQRRIRPILLTTFTTVLGLVPLWLGGGPMWEPMAITIICGLLFSTLLTLFVVPILYSVLFRVRVRDL